HFVLYKYISLIEEFFRSLLFELFKSENKKIMKLSFSKIIECIEKNICSINSDNLNKNILLENKKIFIEIRNSVAHSKILLGNKFDNMDLNYTLSRFKELLPDSYEKGFKTSISKYSENLELMPKILLISLDG
ncbi:MAG: hypothetical protein HDR31_00075, partial [Mycoplasma sp.]|nr:hypothetical protein [Mycoplasma sp.]